MKNDSITSTEENQELNNKIINELIKNGAKQTSKYIENITCPSCNLPDAYTHIDDASVIHCNHRNNCNAHTHVSKIFPHLFNQSFSSAQSFLESRKLNTKLFEFKDVVINDRKAVKIECDGFSFVRFIDNQKPKSKILNSYKDKVFSLYEIDFSKKLYVVESIFDAISLEQCDFQSIATISSSHCPTLFYKENIKENSHIVLLFDNDKAGHDATKKHLKFLKELSNEKKLNLKIEVAFFEENEDANSLLIKNLLNKDGLENAMWRGRLFTAKNANDYYVVLKEKTNKTIFEYNNETFKAIVKLVDNEEEITVYRLADCILKILYSIEDDMIEYRNKIKHRLQLFSNREQKQIVEFTANELVSLLHFKEQMSNYRQIFFGNGDDLLKIYESMLQDKPAKIRQVYSMGYDKKSDCFVFKNCLYDKDGVKHIVNKNGYFEKQGIAPFPEKTIIAQDYDKEKVKKIIETIMEAYNEKGLLIFGFWVATTFSHIIFEKFGFFPFLSLYGDSKCGKSALTKTNNRMFFVDWEGLTMTKANTQKGELRKMAQKSSLVTAMLEGRKDKSRFDYDCILPLFNRNAAQVRAKTTQDFETYDMPFSGALAFVQNYEQFTMKASLERVISIFFSEAELSEETLKSFDVMRSFSCEELASVGDMILKNRKFFEEKLLNAIDVFVDSLKKNGINERRIAEIHAIPAAAAVLALELFDIDTKDTIEKLFKFTRKTAKSKIDTAKNESPIADLFFECLLSFSETEGNGYFIEKDELRVNLPAAISAVDTIFNKSELLEALKQHDAFKAAKAAKFFGKTKKCWVFSRDKISV